MTGREVPGRGAAAVTGFYGLRELEVVDPDGHVLAFGQELNE